MYGGAGGHEFKVSGFATVVALQLVVAIRAGRHCIAEMSNPRAYSEASDVDLVEWSAAGDRYAFDQIVVRHGPFALRVAARVVADSSIAEELVQEAMVRAWRQSRDFDPRRARFSTWLYRIVMNLCIDHGRRVQPEPIPEDFDPVSPQMNADEMLEANERSAAITRAVSDLPVNQRAAMALIYDEGMSGSEAARVLGVSTKAIERLLARARAQLRERLSLEHHPKEVKR
jgi:RNA polymerase sigma-70 factor (ECF subfamily)